MSEIIGLLKNPVFLTFAVIFFIIFMSTINRASHGHDPDEPNTGPFRKRRGALSGDEAREMQELYKGFEDLSRRVEALETILIEMSRKR